MRPRAWRRARRQLAVTPGDYGVDYLLRPVPGATATPAANNTVNIGDVRPALVRIFADNLSAGSLPPRERTYLASLVSAQTGLAQADAEKRVDEAFTEAKSAEAKARLAADKARKTTALAAFLAAATLAVGCAAACAAAAWAAVIATSRPTFACSAPSVSGESRVIYPANGSQSRALGLH